MIDLSLKQLIDDFFLNTIQISIEDRRLIEVSTRSQRDIARIGSHNDLVD